MSIFAYLGEKQGSAAQNFTSNDFGKVDGWFGGEQIHLLNDVTRIHYETETIGSVAEIGVHHGRFFCLMNLLRRSQERAVAIDVFEDQASNFDNSGLGSREAFERNVKNYGGGLEGVSVHTGDSLKLSPDQLLKMTGGMPYRFVHIDGSHTAYACASDLALFAKLLVPGGVIMVDDYYVDGWPGVSEGVARYFLKETSVPVAPFVMGFGKLLLTTKSHQSAHLEAFQRISPLNVRTMATHFDYPTMTVHRPQ